VDVFAAWSACRGRLVVECAELQLVDNGVSGCLFGCLLSRGAGRTREPADVLRDTSGVRRGRVTALSVSARRLNLDQHPSCARVPSFGSFVSGIEFPAPGGVCWLRWCEEPTGLAARRGVGPRPSPRGVGVEWLSCQAGAPDGCRFGCGRLGVLMRRPDMRSREMPT